MVASFSAYMLPWRRAITKYWPVSSADTQWMYDIIYEADAAGPLVYGYAYSKCPVAHLHFLSLVSLTM